MIHQIHLLVTTDKLLTQLSAVMLIGVFSAQCILYRRQEKTPEATYNDQTIESARLKGILNKSWIWPKLGVFSSLVKKTQKYNAVP
jgi:hypothetical protein